MVNKGYAVVAAKQATFGNAVEIIPPVTRGLRGIVYCQGTQAVAARNLCPGKRGAGITVLGTPTFQGTYMEAQCSVNGLETDIVETAALTWIWVGSVVSDLLTAATQPIMMGTFNGSSGASLWFNKHSTLAYPNASARAQAYDDNNTTAAQNIADVSQFRAYCSRVNAANVRHKDLTGNVEATTAFDQARVVSSRKVRIGTYHSSSAQGITRTAAALLFDVDLSDAELAQMYAFVKAEMALAGITV